MTGYETNGNYRYEAIIVIDNNGAAQQHTLAGGFDVKDGTLIAPAVNSANPLLN